MVECLLKQGADTEARDAEDYTPLICAAKYKGNFKTIELLLDHGADVNAQSTTLKTPLYFLSASESRHESLQLLLNRGANVSLKCESITGTTDALTNAIESGAVKNIKALIERGVQLNNSERQYAKVAIRNLQVDALRVLLENGLNPNSESMSMAAFIYPRELRLGHRYDDDYIESNGMKSLLFFAVSTFSSENEIQMKKSRDMVELLLKHGADPNNSQFFKKSPLFAAVKNSRPDIVETLIAHGADACAKDRNGFTVLQTVFEKSHQASDLNKNKQVIIQQLLKHHDLPTLISMHDKLDGDQQAYFKSFLAFQIERQKARNNWVRHKHQPYLPALLSLSGVGLYAAAKNPQTSTGIPHDVLIKIAQQHLMSDGSARQRFNYFCDSQSAGKIIERITHLKRNFETTTAALV